MRNLTLSSTATDLQVTVSSTLVDESFAQVIGNVCPSHWVSVEDSSLLFNLSGSLGFFAARHDYLQHHFGIHAAKSRLPSPASHFDGKEEKFFPNPLQREAGGRGKAE